MRTNLPENLDRQADAVISSQGDGKSVRLRWLLVTACLTILGFGLRISGIETQSFWYDEAVSASLAGESYSDLLFGRSRDNGNPPLYFVAARASSQMFGDSETGFRLFSVLAGTLTIPLLSALGYTLFSPGAGLFAAALLAASPFSLELSTEARCFPLLHLLAVLNTLLFVRWLQRRRRTDLIGYVVTMSGICLTHYYAIALPIAHGISLLALKREDRQLGRWTMAIVVAALLTMFWLPSFLEQATTPGNQSRLADRWHLQFGATPLVYAFGRTLVWRSDPLFMLALASLAACAALGIPALIGFVQSRRDSFRTTLLVSWFAIPIVVPLIIAVTLTPVYQVRYASVGFPAFLILAGFGLEKLRYHYRSAALLTIVALTAVSIHNFFAKPLRDDWRSASSAVIAKLAGNEPVIVDSDNEVLSFHFYLSRHRQIPDYMLGIVPAGGTDQLLNGVSFKSGRRIDPEARDCSQEVLSSDSLWLALCVPEYSLDDYSRLFRRHGYQLSEELHFHRIGLFRFSRNLRDSKGNGQHDRQS